MWDMTDLAVAAGDHSLVHHRFGGAKGLAPHREVVCNHAATPVWMPLQTDALK
jgi:hypothetical protein